MSRKILVIFCCALLAGCGQHVSLRGRITFSDDQTPLTRGMVFFENDLMQARGRIGPDGRYRVGTFKDDDGLPPGPYRIYICGAFADEPPGSPRPPRSLIDAKYEDSRTSNLTVVVDGKTKRFDIQVDRFKK